MTTHHPWGGMLRPPSLLGPSCRGTACVSTVGSLAPPWPPPTINRCSTEPSGVTTRCPRGGQSHPQLRTTVLESMPTNFLPVALSWVLSGAHHSEWHRWLEENGLPLWQCSRLCPLTLFLPQFVRSLCVQDLGVYLAGQGSCDYPPAKSHGQLPSSVTAPLPPSRAST